MCGLQISLKVKVTIKVTIKYLCGNNVNSDDKNYIVMCPRQSDRLVHRKQKDVLLFVSLDCWRINIT